MGIHTRSRLVEKDHFRPPYEGNAHGQLSLLSPGEGLRTLVLLLRQPDIREGGLRVIGGTTRWQGIECSLALLRQCFGLKDGKGITMRIKKQCQHLTHAMVELSSGA